MSDPFGEVIYTYTEEQAIEDGFKADLGFYNFSFGRVRITLTKGFMSEINTLQGVQILLKTLPNIRPQTPSWIVFEKGEGKDRREDEGRTLITHMATEKKVYVILDNHGSHYVLTFLLAEEY